ncbi:hypothetical protein AWB83_04946 [Caballeronia ptereochthonis]|uniref:Uncharacterized protein n=2 Tax=Caballeronia ptereochthonis TaxID=1777144 RepID=A0A158D1G3_9BURK|nr:hypothetical protein AWB83_04946 [Caballeronia ptereochthonis]
MLNAPLLRLEGDLFFQHEIRNKRFQIQVTLGCLTDVFGSDGSLEGDRIAFLANLDQILVVAKNKVMSGLNSPIKLSATDFRFV